MIARLLLNDFIAHGVPLPLPGEAFLPYLERAGVLGLGFEYDELVDRRQHDKQIPPLSTRRGRAYDREGRRLGAWPRFAATVALGATLREKALAEVPGLTHVTCNAAYREHGGAANSAHKEAAALDLNANKGADLKAWYRCAVRLWCELAEPIDQQGKPGTLPFGLGLYTWAGKVAGFAVRSGYRVHVDAFAVAGSRSWQGIRSGFGRPHKIGRAYYGLPVLLAVEQGLDVPSLRDL